MVSFPGIIAVDNPIIGLQRKNGTRWSGASKCVHRVQQCRQGGWTICELRESFAESTNSAESSYPRKFGGHCVSGRATRYRQQGMCWRFFALQWRNWAGGGGGDEGTGRKKKDGHYGIKLRKDSTVDLLHKKQNTESMMWFLCNRKRNCMLCYRTNALTYAVIFCIIIYE